MLRIAVCDDDIQELTRISNLLYQYSKIKGTVLKCDVFPNAIELLETMRRHTYQILLLDIMMPGTNGIQAAREIRELDDETKIIFLTSSPEFAVESYPVDAHSYLLKPGTADKLYPILDKLLLKAQRMEDSLPLVLPSGVIRLPFSRIEFLEVYNKKLLFHLEDASVRELTGALSDFESKLLSRQEFIKVHRSFIVNMEHVHLLGTKELTTYAKQTIPISRLQYTQVRERYMKYLFAENDMN